MFDIEPENLWERIKFKYWNIVPYDWRPYQIIYRLKCRLFKRYNTIKCRYLPYTWLDRDTTLLHSIFEILTQFYEGECIGNNHTDWYNEEWACNKIVVDGQKKLVIDEIRELYEWWKSVNNKSGNIESIYSTKKKKILKDMEWVEDNDFNEYIEVIERMREGQIERPNTCEPLYNKDGKKYASRLVHHHKDDIKHGEYVIAHSWLEDTHTKFIEEMLIRVIRVRPWMWT